MCIELVPQGIIFKGKHYTTIEFNLKYMCNYQGVNYTINHYSCERETICLMSRDSFAAHSISFERFYKDFTIINTFNGEMYCATEVRIVDGGFLYNGTHYYSDEFNDRYVVRSKSSGQILEICTRSYGIGVTDGETFSVAFNPELHEIIDRYADKPDPIQNMMQMIALLGSQNYLVAKLSMSDLDDEEKRDIVSEIKTLEGMISMAYLEVYPNEN